MRCAQITVRGTICPIGTSAIAAVGEVSGTPGSPRPWSAVARQAALQRCHRVATAKERQEATGLILDAGWTAKATAGHLRVNARSVATWARLLRARELRSVRAVPLRCPQAGRRPEALA